MELGEGSGNQSRLHVCSATGRMRQCTCARDTVTADQAAAVLGAHLSCTGYHSTCTRATHHQGISDVVTKSRGVLNFQTSLSITGQIAQVQHLYLYEIYTG